MDKLNNLNILRLLFASTVIISHSYPLTNNEEIFKKITNYQIDLGSLSVDIFFIISGYLIFISLNYSKTIFSYMWKRILRIFPALIIMLCLTMIILVFVSNSSNIFVQKDFYSYFINNLTLYRKQNQVEGIFENNPYPKAINGSLWTLKYEFSMYLAIVPFYWIKNKKYSLPILTIFFIIFSYLHLFNPHTFKNIFSISNLSSEQFYRLGKYFLAGSILTFINIDKIKNNMSIILLISILILSIYFNTYKYISFLILPLTIIIIGFSFNKLLWRFTEKIGDLSYGIYIYGFLVQQVLMNYFEFKPLELMIYSLGITFGLAFLSWHLVENKALKYKNYI